VPGITADQIYTGSLNNGGEWLKLYDAQNNLIDEINAGVGWPGGDNDSKKTLQRIDQNSWQTSNEVGGTPKSENIKTTPPEENPSATSTDDQINPGETKQTGDVVVPADSQNHKGEIIINEVFPNPVGIDSQDEFIEIKNIGNVKVDLTGWKIKNSAKQEFTISSLAMSPRSLVAFYRPKTNLVLGNAADKITLYDQSGRIVDQINYRQAVPEGQSYQKSGAGKWLWAIPSPQEDNNVELEVLPVIQISGPEKSNINEIISFDASDSFDPKNRSLKFLWDFGDGRLAEGVLARQIYTQAGNYEIKLTALASDQASTTEKIKIKIINLDQKLITTKNPTPTTTTAIQKTTTNQELYLTDYPNMFISELLPNPIGADQAGEFIELFNPNELAIDLSGYQLSDKKDGSHYFIIPEKTIIEPNQYLALYRTQTKLTLNNNGGVVRLINPAGALLDQVEYQETKEGQSLVLDEDYAWQKTQTPTPGQINVLNEVVENTQNEPPKVLGAAIEEDQARPDSRELPIGQNYRNLIFLISIIIVVAIIWFLKYKNEQKN
jgi:hypothetical protein